MLGKFGIRNLNMAIIITMTMSMLTCHTVGVLTMTCLSVEGLSTIHWVEPAGDRALSMGVGVMNKGLGEDFILE